MTMRRPMAIVIVAGMWFWFSARPVWAQDPIHKMGRGVVNILTSWIELPKQFHLGTQEDNPVTGVGWGLLKGAGLTVLRGGVGLY